MNAEQKERALTALGMWRSSNDGSQREYQSAELMATLLQEMVDAPEPKPFAVIHLDGSFVHVEFKQTIAGTGKFEVYAAPPAPSVPDGLPLLISGAIYDFAGFLTTQEKTIQAGARVDASAVVDMLKEWAALRGLKLDDAAVLSWQEWLSPTPPEPPADLVRDAELWAPIADFNGVYEVSTIGRIRSVNRIDSDNNRRLAKYLTPTAIRKGYLKVCLWNGGERIERYVHRLVASAFIENPGHLPQVNHKDGDPANNEVSNLEWVTNAQNQTHARRILAKGVRAVYGISLTDGSRIDFASLEIAVEAGFVRANIQKCISGTRKKHKGYAWYDAAIERQGGE